MCIIKTKLFYSIIRASPIAVYYKIKDLTLNIDKRRIVPMVEQRFPKPQVRGSSPLSPEYLYFMRVKGIEPLSSAWKADNLPLIYTRAKKPLY